MAMHSELNEELKQRIYEANSLTHDTYAASHDRAVPYIYRGSVRASYWRLLCELAGDQMWQNADVLELGCGTGTFTDHILARNPRSFTGLDLSVQMLEQARRKFPDPRCAWVRAPLELFSSAANSHFDVIFSFSFLHHLPDLPAGLSQIRSLLKPE